MKLKNYTYFFLIFFLFRGSNISAQRGADWSDCDAALNQYNYDFNNIVRETSELMYSASGLPDFRDNPISFSRDAYQGYSQLSDPTVGGAWDTWNQVLDYNEDLQSLLVIQDYALEGIANTFFDAIEGLDC